VLPLLAGVAVAEAIEACAPVECRLKWPNDVWIHERKVGGVLMTARTKAVSIDYVVLGIGVNLVGPQTTLPPGATSIETELEIIVSRDDLLKALLTKLQVRYDKYLNNSGVFHLEPWINRAALFGETVTVSDRGEGLTGVFVGVDRDGALLIRIDGRLHRVVAGDMSRGPVRST
jgi:BirA family biotin operon repressor/biotin-[acetyl-CoA-carboxylase] ligase